MVEYSDRNTSIRITILNVMCFFFVITERGVYQAKLKELKVCIKDNFILTIIFRCTKMYNYFCFHYTFNTGPET